MEARTWYLGPLGDLRPLVSPDGGVERSVARYGGVHQALSGARTMDITGHRASYTMTIPTITSTESRYLEALHLRTVPGPYYLLDPLGTNRLTRDAALLRPFTGHVVVTGGGVQRTPDGPSDVGVPVTSLRWSGLTPGETLTVPTVPVIAGETITTSVWVGSTSGTTDAELVVRALGVGRDVLDTVRVPITTTGTWQRHTAQLTAPQRAAAIATSVIVECGTQLHLAAMQVENADTPTEWDPGGAAPTVLLDQIERTSPRFPFNDLDVTLLEV